MRLMIIDDEKLIRNSLKKYFSNEGFEVVVASTLREGVQKYREHIPDITILDVRLPDGDGVDLLSTIVAINPDAIVIMITAYGGIRSAIDAIKRGAHDYITKPFDIEELSFAVHKACEVLKLRREVRVLRETTEKKYHFGNIITQSPIMQKVCREARKVAGTHSTVMLRGESGTGKELLCRAIHYSSDRKDQPLVIVNCASLPETLLESELFGFEKGAFSGAMRRKLGLLETAHKGTLFLDEIGDIGLSVQVKLLRFLQEHEFYRLGGTQPVKVDVRIIAATNRNLEEAVAQGTFREDLYYRLHVVPIFIPPLRDRKGDIPLLAQHILESFNAEFGRKIRGFSQEAMEILQRYSWKGNIRELKNVIERAVILAENEYILASDLNPQIRGEEPLRDREADFPFLQTPENIVPLEEMERVYIQRVLDLCGGNKSLASKRLGITRQRLRRKLLS